MREAEERGEPVVVTAEARATRHRSVDELREGLLERLAAELGDAVVGHPPRSRRADLWVRVHTDAWARPARCARDRLGCDYFCFLSAIDWMPSPYGKGEDDPTEPPPERSTAIVPGLRRRRDPASRCWPGS